ncbi:MAG: Gfo/Idh/MocA family oxidoreductase [Lentisphaeria bacterium]|nr:Gfo/Idh/MocA family oxidoreductase [Lentisphaeria bacterium]
MTAKKNEKKSPVSQRPSVGFGIIGTGMIASFHARAINALANAHLVAVYGNEPESVKKFAAEYKVKAYYSLEEFLADPDIQAVTIAVPSGYHGAVAIPAAKAGKHILCEKPLEITLEKADRIIQTCEENNVLLSPVFQARFSRPVRMVKQAMQAGRFGRMVLASAQMRWFRDTAYYTKSSWRGTWALDGGGALMNQAIHTIDLLLYINGAPDTVFAFAGTLTHSIEVEDNLCATVKFRNGSFGTIEVSTSCAPGFPRRLEFSGDKGTVAFEEGRITRWAFTEPLPEDEEAKTNFTGSGVHGGSDPAQIDSMGHELQIGDLADAILTGRKPFLDGHEGRRAIELISGIYESARTGRPFKFKH